MSKLNRKKHSENGVAMILTLGILTLLLVVGVAFVMNMTFEMRLAYQYEARIKARLIAEAGLERAIAELRAKAKVNSYEGPKDPQNGWARDPWFYDKFQEHTSICNDSDGNPLPSFSNLNEFDGSKRTDPEKYTEEILIEDVMDSSGTTKKMSFIGKSVLKIIDCASMIYVNDDNPEIEGIMSRLFDDLGVSSPITIASNIMTKRNALYAINGIGFVSKEQIKWTPGVGDGIYGAIKDYITCYAYVDPNTVDNTGADESRAPINLNTAPKILLKAVLECDPGVGSGYAESLSNTIIANRTLGFWSGFDYWVDVSSGIDATVKQRVKDNVNPNKVKPEIGGTPYYSTEFSFNSGGFYEIESTGKVFRRVGTTDVKLAEHTVSAIVRVYKVWNITKQSQFDQSTEYYRVTWHDTCPTDMTQDTGADMPADYDTIEGSVKLGFWDDFSDSAYTQKNFPKTADYDVDPGKLKHGTQWINVSLSYKGTGQSEDSWNWHDFYARINYYDSTSGPEGPIDANAWLGTDDVGQIIFRDNTTGSYSAFARRNGLRWIPVESDALKATIGEYARQVVWEEIDPIEGHHVRWIRASAPSYYLGIKDGGYTRNQDDDNTPVPLSGDPTHGVELILSGCESLVGWAAEAWNEYIKCYVSKFPSKVVFRLSESGPDGQEAFSGSLYPKGSSYLYDYSFSGDKTYKMLVRDITGATPSQGIKLQVIDSGGTHNYPPTAKCSDEELNIDPNSNNYTGVFGLYCNSALPSWDDLRIMSTDGNYISVEFDSGDPDTEWGTITCTNTYVQDPDDKDTSGALIYPDGIVDEDVTADVKVYDSGTPTGWSYAVDTNTKPTTTKGNLTFYRSEGTCQSVNATGQYCSYRMYLESRRQYGETDYLLKTPVLEDVTVTYIPPKVEVFYTSDIDG